MSEADQKQIILQLGFDAVEIGGSLHPNATGSWREYERLCLEKQEFEQVEVVEKRKVNCDCT